MAALANGAQTLTAGFWFLAQVIPKATGYSFFMLPSTAYNTYQIPIYDNQYPQNPKGADWQASCAKFEGFKAHAWKCMKTVTNPETLEQTQEMKDCNDNTIIYDLISYNKSTTDAKTKNSLKTKPRELSSKEIRCMSSHKETTRVLPCSRLQMESSPSTGHRQNTKEIGKMLVPWQTDSVIALAS